LDMVEKGLGIGEAQRREGDGVVGGGEKGWWVVGWHGNTW